jgi:hypothetical protein
MRSNNIDVESMADVNLYDLINPPCKLVAGTLRSVRTLLEVKYTLPKLNPSTMLEIPLQIYLQAQ